MDSFVKENVSLHEYNMHNYIYNNFSNILNVPKIESYNRKTKQLRMQKIPAMCVADFYGEDIEFVPQHVIAEIRRIIKVLYDNHIVYPDITGYNFIVDDNGAVWILDFEHAHFYFDFEHARTRGSVSHRGKQNFVLFETEHGEPFVNEFINGLHSWNPDFK